MEVEEKKHKNVGEPNGSQTFFSSKSEDRG